MPERTARELVAKQDPTTDNNYTWYNLYSDGWIEQGGLLPQENTVSSATFPQEMKDNNYTLIRVQNTTQNIQSYYPGWTSGTSTRTATGFTYNSIADSLYQVLGYAAAQQTNHIICIKY